MKKLLSIVLILSAMLLPLSGGTKRVLTEKDFQLGNVKYDKGQANITFKDGIFTVDVPKEPNLTNNTRGSVLQVPLEQMKGKKISIHAEFRWENIEPVAGNPDAGGKILICQRINGIARYFVTPVFRGTQKEWQPVTMKCSFQSGLESADIQFGIQQGTGKLEFRNVVLEEEPLFGVQIPEGFKQEYTDRVLKDIPRRGVMSPVWSKLTKKDIEDLAAWKVNLIRYQIVASGLKNPADTAEYQRWFAAALNHLDTLMPALKRHNIKVIVDMHEVPGGRYQRDPSIKDKDPYHYRAFHEKKYRDLFINSWKLAARHFKGNKMIYAFDLCNEPYQRSDVPYNFWQLQYDAAKAIRAIDPEVPIMVECNYMADPAFFEIGPIPLKNIIYTAHMYWPAEYTHQGVKDTTYTSHFYEKSLDYHKMGLNRERLAELMKHVREFQQKYGAKIEIGEFSTVIWAPGAADYLDDVVSIFEEYHWDWTYHAFREWEGWSLEHEGLPDNIQPAKKDTDRKLVILKYLQKNGKK